MIVDYQKLQSEQASEVVAELRDLYAEVYAEPPYHEGPEHVGQFARSLATEVDRPGFALATARTGGGFLAGAAYGFTLAPGEWLEPAADEPPAHLRDVPKFQVTEWMVRAAYRGRGVGRRLLGLVLADRSEPWAVLASNPAAPARAIYDRQGWRAYGRIVPRTMPAMDVLALPLHPA